MATLAFDVYGTLIDTQGVLVALEKHAGNRASDFSLTWREKQLEYSFRRGLMRRYVTFADCTSQALDDTCARFQLPLGRAEKDRLLEVYKTLPAFPDVAGCLARARSLGFRLFAFSNGTAAAVETLLQHVGLREAFLDVVSVDELQSFKPDPAVYAHFLRRAGSTGAETWLISGNPFDVLGALSAGLRSAWIQRSPEARFDPWGIEPTLTVAGLQELPDRIHQFYGRS